jgi:hypothetical protein
VTNQKTPKRSNQWGNTGECDILGPRITEKQCSTMADIAKRQPKVTIIGFPKLNEWRA